jgi:hypothetical protein
VLLGKAKGGYGMNRIRRRLQQFIQLPVLILLGIFLILVGVNQSYQAYDQWGVLPSAPPRGVQDSGGLLPFGLIGDGDKDVNPRWITQRFSNNIYGNEFGSDGGVDRYLLAERIRDGFNSGLILTGGGVFFVLIGIRRTIAEKPAT